MLDREKLISMETSNEFWEKEEMGLSTHEVHTCNLSDKFRMEKPKNWPCPLPKNMFFPHEKDYALNSLKCKINHSIIFLFCSGFRAS